MYVAVKPCTFAGQVFLSGEVIPDELLQKGTVDRLLRVGKIAETGQDDKQPEIIPMVNPSVYTVQIIADEGILPIELDFEALNTLFEVLQKNATQAGEIIEHVGNSDLLLCIHAIDNRKTVQTAARERAKSLNKPDEVEVPEVE